MSKQYTIIVHAIAENDNYPTDPNEVVWEDSETAHKFSGVKKWIELPVPGWEL